MVAERSAATLAASWRATWLSSVEAAVVVPSTASDSGSALAVSSKAPLTATPLVTTAATRLVETSGRPTTDTAVRPSDRLAAAWRGA